MKPARCITLIVSALGFAALGGCGLVSERHPTTESRYMTAAEEQYWNDRQSRQDKSAEWSRELSRQSNERFSHYMGR